MAEKDERRRIIIGDVHGCISELKELMRKCNYGGPEKDRLIFVGDLVDKGPANREVVELAMACHAECVLGNHDEKHLRWNRWNRKVAAGDAEKNPMKSNDEYWDFSDYEWNYFNEMPLFLRLGEEWLVVHGGFETNGRPLEQMERNCLLRVRDVHPESGKYYSTGDPRVRAEGAIRWATAWPGETSVIYGHAPFYAVQVDRNEKGAACLGIDTGCVFGGLLTAVVTEPGSKMYELVQVRAAKKYAEPLIEGEDFVNLAKPEGAEGA